MRPWRRLWFWLLIGGCAFVAANSFWLRERGSYKGFPLPYVTTFRGESSYLPFMHLYNVSAAIAAACVVVLIARAVAARRARDKPTPDWRTEPPFWQKPKDPGLVAMMGRLALAALAGVALGYTLTVGVVGGILHASGVALGWAMGFGHLVGVVGAVVGLCVGVYAALTSYGGRSAARRE